MLAYPAATFDKLASGAAGKARAIVFKKAMSEEEKDSADSKKPDQR
jgi:hypothetical protein